MKKKPETLVKRRNENGMIRPSKKMHIKEIAEEKFPTKTPTAYTKK